MSSKQFHYDAALKQSLIYAARMGTEMQDVNL
jgi:hypothetical protein